MIFTFIGHIFRNSLDGFLKFLLWTLGTGYQIRRSAESEYTNGLSNLDFHSSHLLLKQIAFMKTFTEKQQ